MANIFKYGDITYQDLQLVSKDTLGSHGVNTQARMIMAEKVQLLPIVAAEFRQVCAQMPIVFSPIGKPMPIAVTSLTPGKNAFIQEGKWLSNTYIPLSIRRYPYSLADSKEGKRMLCIDKEALVDNSSTPLFDNEGQASQTLEKAIQYCKEYEQQVVNTEQAIDLLDAEGLFVEKQLSISKEDGSTLKTGVLKVIDAEKYGSLSDEQILKLHKAQALWIIHTHFVSMERMRALSIATTTNS